MLRWLLCSMALFVLLLESHDGKFFHSVVVKQVRVHWRQTKTKVFAQHFLLGARGGDRLNIQLGRLLRKSRLHLVLVNRLRLIDGCHVF